MADLLSDDLKMIRGMISRLRTRLATPTGATIDGPHDTPWSETAGRPTDAELAAELDAIDPVEPEPYFVRSVVEAILEKQPNKPVPPQGEGDPATHPEKGIESQESVRGGRGNDPTSRPEKKVVVFDTTMRDGRQGRFAPMCLSDRLMLARALVAARVDVIELGSVATEAECRAIQKIARQVEGATLCVMARCTQDLSEVRDAVLALEGVANSRVHVALVGDGSRTMIKTPEGRETIYDSIQQNIALVRRAGMEVEFSVEDGMRVSFHGFLLPAFKKAIAAGASIVNLADSRGVAAPTDIARRIKLLHKRLPDVTLSVHCHNDMGLAVANSLAACREGARQVHCTVNGVGRRAGNAALEEVVLNIDNRRERYGLWTQLEHERLTSLSSMVSAMSGLLLPRNKPFVGADADNPHIKDALPAPASLPADRPIGKFLSQQQVRELLSRRGFQTSDEQVERVHTAYKDLTRSKKTKIYESDLVALMFDHLRPLSPRGHWSLVNFFVSTGFPDTTPEAHVKLRDPEARIIDATATGDGAIDAVCKAITKVTSIPVNVSQCVMNNVNRGGDAQIQITFELVEDGQTFTGRAVSTDVMKAVVSACVKAVNEIYLERLRKTYREPEEFTVEEDPYEETEERVVYSFPLKR